MTADPRATVLALLAGRDTLATVCPSEVARAVTPGGDWRAAMPAVHDAVDRLLGDGSIRLTWKGRALAVRTGPYRIARAPSDA